MHDHGYFRIRGGLPARKVLLPLLVGVLALPQLAQAAAVTPGAGSILQQVKPKQAPAPSGTNTGLRLERPKAGVSTSKTRFAVKTIHIEGNTLFATSLLHDLVASGEGKSLTLGDLQRLARKVTDYYHAHGYSLSRAVIPAQTIKDGVVRFEVFEARYGRVDLHNHSRARDGVLHATLSPLKPGAIIDDHHLDRALLLLSDIPGVKPAASFKPGSKVGTSDLEVNAYRGPMVTGSVTADNYGNQYTGRPRVGANLSIAELLGLGDQLTLSGMTAGKGLDYGQIGYDILASGYCGTRVGVSYSTLRYVLGGSLANLRGYGTAHVGSVWIGQPLLRSPDLNVNLRLQYDNKRLRDHIDTTALRTDRHMNAGSVSLTGDVRDGLLAGAVTSWSATWSIGRIGFDDGAAAASDATTARTAGNFNKWEGTVNRLQGLSASNALYLTVSGQWTPNNLDSVEKLVVGGPYSVRAYDMGILSADIGYSGTAEFRHRLNARWQELIFVDGAHVIINHEPWSTGKNDATLGGVGVGLKWSPGHRWNVDANVAIPIGPRPAVLNDRSSVRGWVQLARTF